MPKAVMVLKTYSWNLKHCSSKLHFQPFQNKSKIHKKMHVLVSGYKITALPFSFHQCSDQRNGPYSEQRLSFMATESSEFSSDTFTSSLSSPHFPSAPPPPLSPHSFRPPFPFFVLSFPYLPSFCLLLTPSSPLHPINPSSSPSVLPSGSVLKSHL